MSAPILGRSFLVNGRVQGVFFRRFTQQQAQGLGITGWVRNLSDGRVEAHAFGTDELLTAFYDQLKQGPPGARVDSVTVNAISPEPHSSFAILL